MSLTSTVLRALTCTGLILSSGSVMAQVADQPESVAEPAARSIILVRHGHYVSDPSADETLGPGLSSLGVAQAYLAGARLAGLPTTFDNLYVSPMQRARDTAAAIGENVRGRPFKVIDDLAECTPPTRRADVMEGEKPEDLAKCKAQLDRVFDSYFKPARDHQQTDLMVCHGNVIRYLTTRALDVDSSAWLKMSIGHASTTKIMIEANGRVRVISAGDVGHIPPSLQTGTIADPDRSLAAPVPAK